MVGGCLQTVRTCSTAGTISEEATSMKNQRVVVREISTVGSPLCFDGFLNTVIIATHRSIKPAARTSASAVRTPSSNPFGSALPHVKQNGWIRGRRLEMSVPLPVGGLCTGTKVIKLSIFHCNNIMYIPSNATGPDQPAPRRSAGRKAPTQSHEKTRKSATLLRFLFLVLFSAHSPTTPRAACCLCCHCFLFALP
jgi:hypothetical protein